jgi:hypothetical protein
MVVVLNSLMCIKALKGILAHYKLYLYISYYYSSYFQAYAPSFSYFIPTFRKEGIQLSSKNYQGYLGPTKTMTTCFLSGIGR